MGGGCHQLPFCLWHLDGDWHHHPRGDKCLSADSRVMGSWRVSRILTSLVPGDLGAAWPGQSLFRCISLFLSGQLLLAPRVAGLSWREMVRWPRAAKLGIARWACMGHVWVQQWTPHVCLCLPDPSPPVSLLKKWYQRCHVCTEPRRPQDSVRAALLVWGRGMMAPYPENSQVGAGYAGAPCWRERGKHALEQCCPGEIELELFPGVTVKI